MRIDRPGRRTWARHRLLSEGARRESAVRRGLAAELRERTARLEAARAETRTCAAAARRDARWAAAILLTAAAGLWALWPSIKGDPEPFPSLLNMPSSRMVPEGGPTGR